MSYKFRAYCDICKEGSGYSDEPEDAAMWRMEHFDAEHPTNPMRKENCRIQRWSFE